MADPEAFPVHAAAYRGDIIEVANWVENRPESVHGTDNLLRTPLSHASQAGDDEGRVVGYLLEKGSRVDHRDRSGSTPLHLASGKGRARAVGALLSKGADVNAVVQQTESTPLRLAASGGYVECVWLLLRTGGVRDIDAPDAWGMTSLAAACYNGHVEVARELLSSGADWRRVDGRGRTPLEIARELGHQACVELVQEWDRTYTLARSKLTQEAGSTLTSCADAASSMPSGATPEQERQRRVCAPPRWLLDRRPGEVPQMVWEGEVGSASDASTSPLQGGTTATAVTPEAALSSLSIEDGRERMDVDGGGGGGGGGRAVLPAAVVQYAMGRLKGELFMDMLGYQDPGMEAEASTAAASET